MAIKYFFNRVPLWILVCFIAESYPALAYEPKGPPPKESDVRVGIEIELFANRLKYLIPYLKLDPQFLREHPTDELAAKAIISKLNSHTSIFHILDWKEDAPEYFKNFEIGMDFDVVELRLKDIPGVIKPLESMKEITKTLNATQLLYKTFLKDDVTEGIEYHIHLSYRKNSPLSPIQLQKRLQRLNRLYTLESLALDPNNSAALRAHLECYDYDIDARGLIRYFDETHFELRWHHTSPDQTIRKTLKYLEMPETEFDSQVRAREDFLIKKSPNIFERVLKYKRDEFFNMFYRTPNSPYNSAIAREFNSTRGQPSDQAVYTDFMSSDPTKKLVASYLIEGRKGPLIDKVIRAGIYDSNSEIVKGVLHALSIRKDKNSSKLLSELYAVSQKNHSLSELGPYFAQALEGRDDPYSLNLIHNILLEHGSQDKEVATLALSTQTSIQRVKIYKDALKNQYFSVRAAAIKAMRKNLTPELIELAKQAFDEGNDNVKTEVLLTLKEAGEKVFNPFILKAFANPSSSVKIATLECLEGQNLPEFFELIKKGLDFDHIDIQKAAIRALRGRTDSESYAILKNEIDHPRRFALRKEAFKILVENNPPDLLEIIHSLLRDPVASSQAILALKGYNDASTDKILLSSLTGSSLDQARSALVVLQDRPDRKWVPYIEDFINRGMEPTLSLAYLALKGRNDTHSFQLLHDGIDRLSEKPDRLAPLVEVLRGRDHVWLAPTIKKLFEKIEGFLQSDSIDIRKSALRLLEGRNETEALRLIEIGMRDFEPQVREAATKVLKNRNDAKSYELLKIALNDVNHFVRASAIVSLEGRQEPDALQLIRSNLGDPNTIVKLAAENAISNHSRLDCINEGLNSILTQ